MVDLWVEGLPGPIGATATHPFWSLDRNGWVSAGALRPGEKLGTLDGTAIVAGAKPRLGNEAVYNLEVQGDHTFFVSAAKLWVHNACTWPGIKHWPGYDPSVKKGDGEECQCQPGKH